MLCEKCGKNEAVYFYSETVNGKKRSFALCSDCAPNDTSFGTSILSGFFAENPFFKSQKQAVPAKQCDVCGSTFLEIRKTGKVGCPECYKTFENELMPIIRRIHGTAVYKNTAETQKNAEETKSTVTEENTSINETEKQRAELREKLNTAVKEENYELAATLRDKLRALTDKEEK